MNNSPRSKILLGCASIVGALAIHLTLTACGATSPSTAPAHAEEQPAPQPVQVQIPQPLKTITAESDPAQLVTEVLESAGTVAVAGPFVLTDATGGYGQLFIQKGDRCSNPTKLIGTAAVTGGGDRREMHGRYFVPKGSVLCVVASASANGVVSVVYSGFRPYDAAAD